MKKILVLIILGFILSGCATYKFQKPTTEGAGGYLVCYDGKPIEEYTVGKEKSLPDLDLAKERFKRRRGTVEYYYKQMDIIESRLKVFFWDPPAMLVDLIGGVFRWPFTAMDDYKYNRNPQYREKIDRLDEQKDELEKARVKALKEKLTAYIAQDLEQESTGGKKKVVAKVAPKSAAAVSAPVAQAMPVETVAPVKEIVAPPVVSAPVIEKVTLLPVAIIIAKPAKGNSPLLVKFSGQKSYSKSGKIVAYDWNFGDGDTSTKKNPENIFYSTTFGARPFTVTLTVRDDTGAVATATETIEVSTL